MDLSSGLCWRNRFACLFADRYQMTCTLDHAAPDIIPTFLCRQCHPDTAVERRRLEREIRELENRIARRPDPMLQNRLQELQLAELCL